MISNLPEVPPNWIKVRFDEIAENITDRIDKPKESGLEYYIGLEHLDTDQIRIKRFGSTEDVKATKFLCKKGDIIFGKRNAYLRKVAVTDRDAIVSAHSMVIRPKGDLIVPDFLPCFMQSSAFWKTAHAISEGSMSPTIKWKTLAKQEFWIPSVEEQKKIAKVLWTIEKNAENNEELIKIAEIYKKGLLNKLINKGVNHKKFKLSDVAKIIMGQSPKGDTYNEISEGKPLINGPAEFNEYYPTPVQWTSKPTKVCEVGDILFCVRGNTTGRMNFADQEYCIGRGVAAISGRKNISHTEFVHLILEHNQNEIYRIANGSGSTFPNITSTQLKEWPCFVPPIDEQEKIIFIFESLTTFLKLHSNNVDKLFSLKKKITDEFLSGTIKIPPRGSSKCSMKEIQSRI